MSDNDHIDAQWLRAAQSPPPPPRRRGFGCALSLLVLILVLAGVLFYPRVYARLTPVPAVQIQMESSVLPDTAPHCTANPRTAAVLRFVLQLVNERGQVDAADVQALRDQGVNDEQIVEIVAHVALNLFTNYVNVALGVPVDFPGVKLRPAR